MTEYLETWRRALEDRGMRVSRTNPQFIDFKFGQNNGQVREPVNILGKSYTKCIILGFSVQARRRQDNRNHTELECSMETLLDI